MLDIRVLFLNQERKDARIGRIMLKEKKGVFLNQERKDARIRRIMLKEKKGYVSEPGKEGCKD